MPEYEAFGVSIDAAFMATVAAPEVLTASLQMLARDGRVNFFAGFGKNAVVPIDVNRIRYRGLRIVGTTVSANFDFFKCLTLVAEKRVDLKRFISRTFRLADINTAFEYAASAQGLKT